MRPRQGDVAAEQRLALPLEARTQGVGERADAGDDGDAERDAGDEDVETRKPAAQFAQREAEQTIAGTIGVAATRCRLAADRSRRSCGAPSPGEWLPRPDDAPVGHADDALAAPGERSSWVTSTSVALRRALQANSRSTTCRPVLPSRLPVGSSARMMRGRGTSARASATRCCSPPDSWAGK